MTSMKIAAVLGVAALAVPAAALAAGRNGITTVSPKPGATIPKGKRPTFTFKVLGEGKVWVHVCRSRQTDVNGVICSEESIGRAVKKGSLYAYSPKMYTYPDFWLAKGGTYYWQAFRIACTGTDDCNQEGPVVKVVVR